MSWTTCTGRSTVLRYDAKRRAVSLQQLRFYYSSPSIAHRPTYSVLCAWSSTIRFRIANWFIAWLKSSRSSVEYSNRQLLKTESESNMTSNYAPVLRPTWHSWMLTVKRIEHDRSTVANGSCEEVVEGLNALSQWRQDSNVFNYKITGLLTDTLAAFISSC